MEGRDARGRARRCDEGGRRWVVDPWRQSPKGGVASEGAGRVCDQGEKGIAHSIRGDGRWEMGDGSWMETAESTGETIHPPLSSVPLSVLEPMARPHSLAVVLIPSFLPDGKRRSRFHTLACSRRRNNLTTTQWHAELKQRGRPAKKTDGRFVPPPVQL